MFVYFFFFSISGEEGLVFFLSSFNQNTYDENFSHHWWIELLEKPGFFTKPSKSNWRKIREF